MNINIKTGTFLISTPIIGDDNFEKVIVFITEHGKNGTSGFVINKLFPLKLNDLVAFNKVFSFHLYHGGPVENEKLYFIHRRPDLIEDGIPVSDSIYLGGNFEQVIVHINNKTLSENDIKLFIGYCGWDFGQIETETADGCWLPADTQLTQTVFAADEMLWDEMYAMWAN